MKAFFRYCIIFFSICCIHSCTTYIQEPLPELPFNPFDTINYNPGGNSHLLIDSNSFLGIHHYILSVKCAVPACHDGSFEPDFRTVESSYNQLVYHPVVKNNSTNSFTYRVVPGQPSSSWLFERIITNDPILGRMPLYDSLPPQQIEKIRRWIAEGAKDIFGNSKMLPNQQPATFGLVAYENAPGGYRYDTIRSRVIDPFIVPQNKVVNIWIGLYDDADLPPLLTVNKIKFSSHPYDFSNAIEQNMQVVFSPHMAPSIVGGVLPYFHNVTINTGDFVPGRVYYIRVYVQDSAHNFATEIPENGSPIYLLTYFSFKVQ